MSWDITWETVFREKEMGKYPAESLIRFIARNFYGKDRKAVKILEIGCGGGANVWYMAKEGFDVYGIDGSETAVKRAFSRVKDEGLSADLKTGDAEKLPYKDGYFDAVIDVECLYSNPGKGAEKIIAEVKRVLKKGGLFYSRTFADGMYTGSSREELGKLEYRGISDGPLAGKGFVRLIDRKGIDKLYGGAFDVVSVDKLEYTDSNGKIKVSEWIIISRNGD